LTLAYGQMILKSGFFHADPHPGNILICKSSEASYKINFFSNISFMLFNLSSGESYCYFRDVLIKRNLMWKWL